MIPKFWRKQRFLNDIHHSALVFSIIFHGFHRREVRSLNNELSFLNVMAHQYREQVFIVDEEQHACLVTSKH